MGVIFFKPPVMDTSVNIESHRAMNYRNIELQVGRRGNEVFRSLLQFDFSRLPFTLPIFCSTLYLFMHNNLYDQPQTIQLFQLLSRWDQKTLSRNQFPLASNSPVDSIVRTKQSKCCLAFNITPLMTAWQNNLSANMGVMIKTKCEMNADNLFSLCSSKFHDSSYWPCIEINYLESKGTEKQDSHSLDVRFSVDTTDEISYTKPVNILNYNYSYLVINKGKFPANAFLQISPDGVVWLTQTEIAVIPANALYSFAPNYTAKFSRLCYKTIIPGQRTCLTVYVQGTR